MDNNQVRPFFQPALEPHFITNQSQGQPSHRFLYSNANYNQQQYGRVAQPQQQMIHVIQQSMMLGPGSTRMTCPHCQNEIETRVSHISSSKTHMVALVLCIVGCFCCVCAPYCLNCFMNSNHSCPNCQRFIGNYRH